MDEVIKLCLGVLWLITSFESGAFRFVFFPEVSIDSFEKVKSRLIKVTVQFKC